MSSRLKKVRVVLLALVCLAGCASELAHQQTPEQQLGLAQQEEWNARSQAMNTWDPSVGGAFLERYPNSIYKEAVQEYIEKKRKERQDRPVYEPYKQQDSIAGYKEFISKYPDNSFIDAAKVQLAELEYSPSRNLHTISSYQEFLRRYPHHKYNQDARERLELLQHPPQSSARTTGKTAAIIVTSGPLSQPYEVLGSVHADTIGVINMGAVFYDAIARSPLARAIQRTPTKTTEGMNHMLRDKAQQQYGSRVDAVINVTYSTKSNGTVFADGIAVHFTSPSPSPAPAASTRSAEERLKEIRGLLDQGLITQGEYERKRLEILKGL